jgi:hypothetical protein
MDATTEAARKYDGQYLLYNRATEKVLFSKTQKDTKRYLTVGMVWAGMVAGKPVAYWLEEIKKDGNQNGEKEA